LILLSADKVKGLEGFIADPFQQNAGHGEDPLRRRLYYQLLVITNASTEVR
jgi:hypothetical protein